MTLSARSLPNVDPMSIEVWQRFLKPLLLTLRSQVLQAVRAECEGSFREDVPAQAVTTIKEACVDYCLHGTMSVQFRTMEKLGLSALQISQWTHQIATNHLKTYDV